MAYRAIPGVTAGARTDLPILLPFDVAAHAPPELGFSRWLGALPLWAPLALLALWPALAAAQGGYGTADAFAALLRWIPFLLESGFLFNVIISLFAMLIGTLIGVMLGLGQVSRTGVVRRFAWFFTQLFRNSPWLVILFIVLLALPFEIRVFGLVIQIPAWMKAVFGLSLPVMANISEIVRGAIQSAPTAQWEAAEALGFSRHQTLWQIILPQVFRRMIPPWMNWYAILTMATPLCSLLGVGEIITLSRQAMEAENNQPELLVPFYGFALVCFFLYCYPIARLTIRLERRYAVKL
ncbi:amino acid ABC transporter permease [Pikeienuella piscinae]|uniref:Amino acid ABC transporter permease n=1 Tax=Pikeienuella piscinae TaxID=2748098 RepID=A0A7M3T548_9RHOB|nr:amino acid ABC transporter permease [Pikeienuella piscinae]QIE57129.1 amino acid ABC transporter permease [Pikeienuella piscinae]